MTDDWDHLTTIRTVFTSRGMEKTKDMNIPFESKYWKLEKDLQGGNVVAWFIWTNRYREEAMHRPTGETHLQFMAANSFKCSALYTRPTAERRLTFFTNYIDTRKVCKLHHQTLIMTQNIVHERTVFVFTYPWRGSEPPALCSTCTSPQSGWDTLRETPKERWARAPTTAPEVRITFTKRQRHKRGFYGSFKRAIRLRRVAATHANDSLLTT